MKRYLKILLSVLVILALVAVAIRLSTTRRAQLADMKMPEPIVHAVNVAHAQAGELAITSQFIGTIEPIEQATIAFRVEGHLVSATKDAGDVVDKGEIVAQVDQRLFVSQAAAIEAELEGARSELAQLEKQLERRKTLFEKNLIDQEAIDQAKSSYEMARARVDTLKARLASAKIDMAYATAHAPFDGVITSRLKQSGDLARPGEPVYMVENPDAGYKIIIRIPRETARIAAPGSKAAVSFNSRKIQTTLHRVYPSTTEGRLATAEIRLDRRPFGLPSGSFVSVDLHLQKLAGIIVPAASILEDESGARVFRVNGQNRVEIVKVTVMGQQDGAMVIDGPVVAGDRLVRAEESMLLLLTDQSQVRLIGDTAP